MTERMVSVPVEDLAGKLKAIRDKFLIPTPDKDYTDYAIMTRCIDALTAAPVREEGGAVLEDALDAWIVEGMKKADQRIAEITPVGCSGMTPEDVETGRVSAYQKGFQNGVKSTLTDAAFVIMNAALATREEAPAEAGEREKLIQDLSDAERWRRLPGNENHLATAALFERAISALRAQPPAREDAQPVAWRYKAKFSDPAYSHWHYTDRDPSAAKTITNVQPLYTTPPAPEAEKLRVAVEALKPFAQAFRGLSSRWEDHETHWQDATSPIAVEDLRRAAQALAALQQEGRDRG